MLPRLTCGFYKCDAGPLTCILATNTSARIYVSSTNNSAANWQAGAVIIRHIADDTYEKRLCTANDGSTNLILTVATMGAMSVGDLVYPLHLEQPAYDVIRDQDQYLRPWAGLCSSGKRVIRCWSRSSAPPASLNAVGGFYAPTGVNAR
jgi:hypothetical protein